MGAAKKREKETLNAESSKSEETQKNTTKTKEDASGFATSESLREQSVNEVEVEHVSLPQLVPRPFTCPKCPETFGTKGELEGHMFKIAGRWPTYCGSLARHSWIIDELVENNDPCCTYLSLHNRGFHCNKCGVRFRYVTTFLEHKRNDGTCDIEVEKCPKCNDNVRRGMQCARIHIAYDTKAWKSGHEGDDDDKQESVNEEDEGESQDDTSNDERMGDDDTVHTELEGSHTSPVPSGSNAPLIDPHSTASKSKETGLDENGIIHIQPAEALLGQKVVGVPLSVLKNERVRKLMKEVDPSLDFSKLEDDIGVIDSEKEKDDEDDTTSQVVLDTELIAADSEPETGFPGLNLCLPKTQVVVMDYEDFLEKSEIERRRRKRKSRLMGKSYLFKDRPARDTQAVHSLRWDHHLTNPTPWSQLPQELKVDADFLKLVKPAALLQPQPIQNEEAVDLSKTSE